MVIPDRYENAVGPRRMVRLEESVQNLSSSVGSSRLKGVDTRAPKWGHPIPGPLILTPGSFEPLDLS